MRKNHKSFFAERFKREIDRSAHIVKFSGQYFPKLCFQFTELARAANRIV
jgi:hypothetical protein